MKKTYLILLLVVLAVIAIISIFFFRNTGGVKYKIFEGYMSVERCTIANSLDEYNQYIAQLERSERKFDSYSSSFFNNKSIAFVYIGTGSGSNKVSGKNVSRDGNKVNVEYDIKYATGNTTDDINRFSCSSRNK